MNLLIFCRRRRPSPHFYQHIHGPLEPQARQEQNEHKPSRHHVNIAFNKRTVTQVFIVNEHSKDWIHDQTQDDPRQIEH